MRKATNGSTYCYNGDSDEAEREYERFRGCLLQLMDPNSMLGNLEGQWVIFKDGWVLGLCSYSSRNDAEVFAHQIFRDEPDANYIVVEVREDHAESAMHLLASALSDVESNAVREKRENKDIDS